MVVFAVLLGVFLTILIALIIRTNRKMVKTINLMIKQEERKVQDSDKIRILKEELERKQEIIENLESKIPVHLDGHEE